MLPFFIIVFGAAVVYLVIELVPGLREKLRGWTTVIFGSIVAGLPIVGNLVDAINGSDWQTFVPKDWWPYFIVAIGVWTIIKRFQTLSAVGRKP